MADFVTDTNVNDGVAKAKKNIIIKFYNVESVLCLIYLRKRKIRSLRKIYSPFKGNLVT